MIVDKPIRTAIGPGAYFTHIADPKFKRNRISVNFIMPLDRITASVNAILPFLLRRGSKSCPDFTRLNARLYELYGAALDAEVTKYNGFQILQLSIRGLDDRYALEGEDITASCAALLCDVVFAPNFDDGGLPPAADVALERQNLVDTIEAEINDKRTYALGQCLAAMCGDEPVSIRRYGYVESAEAITPEAVADAWRRVIESARVEITFAGPGDPAPVRELFSGHLRTLERAPHACGLITLRDHAEVVREETEEMDLHQSKLVMGFRCAGITEQEDSLAAQLFAAMLGGTPFSKLFMNVREKLSLCYYCAARYDISNKLLLIDSGVEPKNKQTAQEEILRQLEAMRNGDFTEEDLANTKLFLINYIKSVNDSPSSLASWYLTRTLRGVGGTPYDDCEAIAKIDAEALRRIANNVTLDTVYHLAGKEVAVVES